MNNPGVIQSVANRLRTTETEFDFIQRVELERALFLVAKEIAETRGFPLHGLSASHKEELVSAIAKGQLGRDVGTLIARFIDAKTGLRILACGESYLLHNLAGPSLPGRANAIRVFGGMLNSLVLQVHELYPRLLS